MDRGGGGRDEVRPTAEEEDGGLLGSMDGELGLGSGKKHERMVGEQSRLWGSVGRGDSDLEVEIVGGESEKVADSTRIVGTQRGF